MTPLIALVSFSAGFLPAYTASDATFHCFALSSPNTRSQLKVSPSLSREVVLVPDKLGPAEFEALKEALHAKAALEDGRWTIMRSGSRSEELRAADLNRLKKQIDNALARVDSVSQRYQRSSLPPAVALIQSVRADFNEKKDLFDSGPMQATEISPSGILLANLLRNLSSTELAKITPGRIAIFSNLPEGAEHPLIIPQKTIEEYLSAQEKLAFWAENSLVEEKLSESYRWLFPTGAFVRGERTIRLTISRRESQPSFAIEVFDARGKHESNAALTVPGFGRMGESQTQSRLGEVAMNAEMISALRPSFPWKPNIKEDFLDPTDHEPLDTFVREALILWARAKGFDRIIACVPDELLTLTDTCVRGTSLDLDAVAKAISNADCETIIVNGRLVVRPSQPLQEEALRVDRKPLSTLVAQAKSGRFGLVELCNLHLSYLEEFDDRPALRRMLQPIRDFFGLRSVNWTLPHSLLSTLGQLSLSERKNFMAGGRISLGTPMFSSCRSSLAEYASLEGTGEVSDLQRTSSRLPSLSGGVWLESIPGPTYPLVQRISKGYMEIGRVDPVTGTVTTEKGTNVVVDGGFVSAGYIASELPLGEAFQILDRTYRFRWVEESEIKVRVVFGNALQVGPFTLRERLRESKVAVPLGQVPGFKIPTVKRP